ncbi:hypothetical protein ACTFIW_001882 [Dictyostelium discoideum]
MSTGLKCSSCGASNSSTSKFCTSCGNKMAVITTAASSSSPTAPSKSFLAPTISKVTVTTTTTTTTSSRPASTIVKPSHSTTTTTSRPASTIVKPTTTTTASTTSTTPTKSILKPTTHVTSPSTTTTTNNNTIPSKSILKPVSTTVSTPKTTEPLTRPKSHTISVGTGSKPTTTTTTATTTPSFVKMAAKSRESLDNQAQRDTMVLQGSTSTPLPSSKSTLQIKKPTTTTTTTTTTTSTPTSRPASMSVSVSTPKPIPSTTKTATTTTTTTPNKTSSSPSSPSLIDKQKEAERLEKQIQIEKEKFHQKEREIEQNRQQQYEKEKQIEREKLEREKEKQIQIEREKFEREKQQQQDKDEREKHKQHEKEEREKHKQHEREEREQEKQHQKQLEKEREQEKVHQKQLEKEEKEKQHQEREKLKQFEKDEKERIRKLEREKYFSTPQPQTTSNSINPTPSSPSISSPSLIASGGSINNGNCNSNNNSHNDSGDEDPTTTIATTTTTTTTTNKKKRDKEKQKSRIFSLFSRIKDDEENDEDELVISSPSSPPPPSSPTVSPTPDNPNQSSFNIYEKDSGDSRDSGDFSNNGGTIGEGQLRKWAIKRNELQKSEGNLFAPSSPSQTSLSCAGFPIGSHSPNSSSGSLNLALNGNGSSNNLGVATSPLPISSFIPSSSPMVGNNNSPSGFQMGTSRISSPNPPPDLPNNLPQAIEQRDRVIEEIIVTEADYIRDLEIMVWLKKEMTIHDNDTTKGSTLEEINSLFSNVEQLLLVNKELYKKFCNFDNSFNTKVEDSGSEKPLSFIDHIASGFVSMADFLKSYFVYCSNQQKALSTFSALKGKNCTYLAYLLTRRECRSLPFDSFLIKPVQRVCKYPLLIRELIKTTPQDSKSYENLINAQSKIESIVFAVNEKKREFDSQMKMLDIQNGIIESGDTTTKILSPSRKLIKEGSIQSWGSTIPTGTRDFIFKKKNKEGYYYLFNDLFLYAEIKNDNSIKVKSEIPFEHSVICDTLLDNCAFDIKNKNLWCMFSLETLEEKQLIFKEIESQMLSYQGLLQEYQKYVDDRNCTSGSGGINSSISSSNRNSTISNNGSTALTNGTSSSNLSLSSNSITLNGASSSSSSSELLSIEEWKLLVKNKPLPALPTTSNNNNSNNNSPSISRINKALPTPPPPSKN